MRQNANVRPSRSRFKIYIIDEVHMLTREAFNALLKTLEEPPEHVKFLFCTTEPSKIPVTILSRCQRFDFAGILTSSIGQRLREIVEAEGVEAEPEALAILARRAAGSMRDAQSLLEQLLAFSPQRITVADVHGMLGTAGEERLTRLLGHIVSRQPSAALAELDAAVQEGVDVGQLIEQLFGFLRDAMATAVGCSAESFLYASPVGRQQVISAGQELGLETILAAMQILDQTLSRLRYSTQGRILAELALVRICQLEDLEELPALIAQLQGGGHAGPESVSTAAPPPAAKRKADPDESLPPALEAPQEPAGEPRQKLVLDGDSAASIWDQVVARLGGMAAGSARNYSRVAISAPNNLVVHLKPGYTFAKAICERPDQLAQFQRALAELTGESIRVQFAVEEVAQAQEPVAAVRPATAQQRLMEVADHPMIRRAGELFGAQPVRVDEPASAKET